MSKVWFREANMTQFVMSNNVTIYDIWILHGRNISYITYTGLFETFMDLFL